MQPNKGFANSGALCALALVASFTLALTVTARAAVQTDATEPSFTAGVVLAVDAARGRISLEQAGYEGVHMNVVVDSDTRLMKRGESVRLSDIRVGDPVSVEYEIGAMNRKIARRVEVLTMPGSSNGTR